MPISLHTATIESYKQILASVAGYLDKGLAHCRDNDIEPQELVESRLFPDMAPLRFQIISVAHHSAGALEGVKAGQFGPPSGYGELDYAGMQKLVADTQTKIAAVTPDEVEALGGRDVVFEAGERVVPFTGEGFLLTFSMPNFYFHATTGYDILRSKGVKIGKRDFMGKMRVKQ